MEPIQSTGIPIEIRHLYSNQSGLAPTTIGPDIVNQNYIKAIGCLRSVSKIEIDTKGIDSSKSVGELLIQLNQKDITCWSLNYLPSKVELVISQNKFNHAKEIIYSIFEKMKSNDYPALISLIGNLELEEFEFSLLSKMKLNQELSVLSKTPHSIQLLCKNDNIKSILEELSKSVKSKQIKLN
jgi:aspartokinase